MEAAASPTVVRSSFSPSTNYSNSVKARSAHGPDFVRFYSNSQYPIQHRVPSSSSSSKVGYRAFQNRHKLVVRVSASSTSQDTTASAAPLEMESPIGKFLSEILATHPHLVPAAVEKQLDQLQTDREAEKQQEDTSASGNIDLVLYRRIAELKANERKKSLEEILYTLVVQKFMDSDVSLTPIIKKSGRVDTWPIQDGKLEQLHSPEAYEMIQNHLAIILGKRLNDTNSVAQMSKMKAGQVYAASLMYGYFLKRVDQRFQLEKAMNLLPNGSSDEEVVGSNIQHSMNIGAAMMRSSGGGGGDEETMTSSHPAKATATSVRREEFGGHGMKPSRLRSYVMSFEGETLQKYAAIRSKEAVSIIEKHTAALFGRPEISVTPQDGTVDSSTKDELMKISFGGLKRLVVEAVTIGSFLWEVESHVDSRYRFVTN